MRVATSEPSTARRVERFVIVVHHMASVCAAGPPGASAEEQVVSKHDACDCKCEHVLHGRQDVTVRIPAKGLANVHAKQLEFNAQKGANVELAKESHARTNLPVNLDKPFHFNNSLQIWK